MSKNSAALAAALVLSAFLASASFGAGAPAPAAKASDAVEKELMVAENRLMDAVRTRDRATLEKMVSADFAYTSPRPARGAGGAAAAAERSSRRCAPPHAARGRWPRPQRRPARALGAASAPSYADR